MNYPGAGRKSRLALARGASFLVHGRLQRSCSRCFTVAHSKRLADVLDAISDSRLGWKSKWRAMTGAWRCEAVTAEPPAGVVLPA